MRHHLAQFTGSATAQNNFTVNGTLGIPGFSDVSASLADLTSSTSSYLTSSGSVDFSDVTNKPALLSSSAQIAAEISGAFTDTQADLTSLNNFTSSIQSEVDALQAVTGGYAITSSISGAYDSVSSSFASALTTAIANVSGAFTDTQADLTPLNNFTSSIQSEVDALQAATGSYLTSSGSVDFSDITNKPELISGSNILALTGSDLTTTDIPANNRRILLTSSDLSLSVNDTEITFSLATQHRNTSLNSFTSSIQSEVDALQAVTGGYAITSSISGAYDSVSSSFAQDLTTAIANVSGAFVDTQANLTPLNNFTSSIQSEVDAIQVFTASAQLEIDAIQNFTSSVQNEVDSIQTFTASAQLEIDALQTFTSSIQSEVDALQAVTGGYAITSSISGAFNSTSASFSTTITNIIDGTTAVATASYAISSSHEITHEVSSSYADTASFALTASYALNAGDGSGAGFPFSGSAIITGSLVVSQSAVDFTNTPAVSASLFSGSFIGDGSGLTNITVAQTTTVTSSFSNTTSHTVSHNFGTENVIVSVYDNSSPPRQIIPEEVELTDGNNVTLTFSPAASGHAVVAQGGHIVTASLVEEVTVTSSFTGQTSVDVAHNFNSQNIIVTVYSGSNQPRQIIPEEVTLTDNNNVNVIFPTAQSGHIVVAKGGHAVSGTINNAISASFATTASHVVGLNIESSSYATTASYAHTASFYGGSVTSASFATTSSHAITASYALNAGGGGFNTTFTTVTEVTASHNLGSKNVGVFVYDNDDIMFIPDRIQTFDTNNVHITFNQERSGRVVIVQ